MKNRNKSYKNKQSQQSKKEGNKLTDDKKRENINDNMDNLITPEFDSEKGRYEEETSNYEFYNHETEELEKIENEEDEKLVLNEEDTEYLKKFEENLTEYEKIKGKPEQEEDESKPEKGIEEEIGGKCFPNDDLETKKYKLEIIKKFEESTDYRYTCDVLQYKLESEFEGKRHYETGQDIVSRIIEGFLRGKKWDARKYPNLKRQIFYKFKRNIRPNIKDMYYGEHDNTLSQDEIDLRIFESKNLRKSQNEKPNYTSINECEFEIDADGKEASFKDDKSNKMKAVKIPEEAYESLREKFEKERLILTEDELKRKTKEAIKKCKDPDLVKVANSIMNAGDNSKINQHIAKETGIDIKKIDTIKKRLKRYLLKEIPNIKYKDHKSKEFEEKLAMLTNYKNVKT